MGNKEIVIVGGTVIQVAGRIIGILTEDSSLYWVDRDEQKGVVNDDLGCGDVVVVTIDIENRTKIKVLNVTPMEGDSHESGDNL